MSEWTMPRSLLDDAQAQLADGSTEAAGADRVQRAAEPGQPAEAVEQSGSLRPTAEQVADRVYELLLQDLRLENERLGR